MSDVASKVESKAFHSMQPPLPPKLRVIGKQTDTMEVRPDGRECRCCAKKDSDPDEVDVTSYYCWGYPPKLGMNQGRICFYCIRTFQAKYEQQLSYTITSFCIAIGSDAKLHEGFLQIRSEAVKMFVAAGKTRGFKLDWETVDQRVVTIKRNEVKSEQDPDLYMLFSDYVKDNGDPASNSKGHSRCVHEGHDCVCIPGKLQWKVYKIKSEGVEMQTVQQELLNVKGFLFWDSEASWPYSGTPSYILLFTLVHKLSRVAFVVYVVARSQCFELAWAMDSFATRVDILLLKFHYMFAVKNMARWLPHPSGLISQQHTYFQLGHIVHTVRRDPCKWPINRKGP
jgi:hypothetical protein